MKLSIEQQSIKLLNFFEKQGMLMLTALDTVLTCERKRVRV